jgi:hypothetical protein
MVKCRVRAGSNIVDNPDHQGERTQLVISARVRLGNQAHMGLDARHPDHRSVALLKPPVSPVLAGKPQARSRVSNPGEGMRKRDACHRAGKRRKGVGSALGHETIAAAVLIFVCEDGNVSGEPPSSRRRMLRMDRILFIVAAR